MMVAIWMVLGIMVGILNVTMVMVLLIISKTNSKLLSNHYLLSNRHHQHRSIDIIMVGMAVMGMVMAVVVVINISITMALFSRLISLSNKGKNPLKICLQNKLFYFYYFYYFYKENEIKLLL